MTPLAEFEACSQPRIDCREGPPGEVSRYESRVPEVLAAHWRVSGWCGYSDGAFWLTNPRDYEKYVDRLPALQGAPVIARTAFASLFLWREGKIWHYLPTTNDITPGSAYPEIFFNSACCSKSFRRDVWRLSAFRKARKRLGPLKYDECYGYSPIPALGGSGADPTLTKVKIMPYLEILRQAITE